MDSTTPEIWLEIVQNRASVMRFGTVEITIHDGEVTQVAATERTRQPAQPRTAASRGEQPVKAGV